MPQKVLEIHPHTCRKGYGTYSYPITQSGRIAYITVGPYELLANFCPNCGLQLIK